MCVVPYRWRYPTDDGTLPMTVPYHFMIFKRYPTYRGRYPRRWQWQRLWARWPRPSLPLTPCSCSGDSPEASWPAVVGVIFVGVIFVVCMCFVAVTITITMKIMIIMTMIIILNKPRFRRVFITFSYDNHLMLVDPADLHRDIVHLGYTTPRSQKKTPKLRSNFYWRKTDDAMLLYKEGSFAIECN